MDTKKFEQEIAVLAENILYDTADAMVRYMESSEVIPVDTHNLKDSTGVGVYIDGALKRFLINPKAAKPRNLKDGRTIWGRDIIIDALYLGETKYSTGYKLVLFSSMPYASEQDEAGKNKGYFSDILVSGLVEFLDEIVKRYAAKRD